MTNYGKKYLVPAEISDDANKRDFSTFQEPPLRREKNLVHVIPNVLAARKMPKINKTLKNLEKVNHCTDSVNGGKGRIQGNWERG